MIGIAAACVIVGVLSLKRSGEALYVAFDSGGFAWLRCASWALIGYGACIAGACMLVGTEMVG